MFARQDFSTFLVCCSGDLSDNESEEKPSVAIYGGSICILTGLFGKKESVRQPVLSSYFVALRKRVAYTDIFSLQAGNLKMSCLLCNQSAYMTSWLVRVVWRYMMYA